MLTRIALLGLIALTIAGCQSEFLKNYQFGDVTRASIKQASELTVMRYRYCTESNEKMRSAILEAIHIMVPKYPDQGICTDLRGLIKEIKGFHVEPTAD